MLSFSIVVDDDLAVLLNLMLERLQKSESKRVDARTGREWCIFTDASCDYKACLSGLGGVLVNSAGQCCAWFSLRHLQSLGN